MGTVDSLLAEHVNFRVTCVDRVGVAGYIRGLQFEGGVVKFILQRGYCSWSGPAWATVTITMSPDVPAVASPHGRRPLHVNVAGPRPRRWPAGRAARHPGCR